MIESGDRTTASTLGPAERGRFSSLRLPNFRRYFFGQSTSLVGTWMQAAAQSWLVLSLTHSSSRLGIVIALQTLPLLLLGAYAGVIIDRVDRRRLQILLQAIMAFQAVVLAVLTLSHVTRYWEICVLASVLGFTTAFDLPSRQAILYELVGPDDVPNAVSLTAIMINAARAIGPAIAGVVIAVAGVAICFVVNAATFLAVILALKTMDKATLNKVPFLARSSGQLRAGIRYAKKSRELSMAILMMVIIGTFTYEYPVSLPLVATQTFHSGSRTFGFMYATMGLGAVAGGVLTAGKKRVGARALLVAAVGFGSANVAAAVAPVVAVEYVALIAVGVFSISFITVSNSTVQLGSELSMRGRAMSLWSMAFQGTTPIGGPVIGWVVAAASARVALMVGAAACFAAAGIGAILARRTTDAPEVELSP
ncbi:MAG: transporter [Acidimicrobiaceae bacterium]|nr:transporter [Acidimicrobiaceae bacterium]